MRAKETCRVGFFVMGLVATLIACASCGGYVVHMEWDCGIGVRCHTFKDMDTYPYGPHPRELGR